MDKQDWTTRGGRLRWAIDNRPREGKRRGVRKFAEDIAARSAARVAAGLKAIPGITLPSIISYLPPNGGSRTTMSEPNNAFLEEAAKLCNVRIGWLMSGEGFPTNAHERAAAVTSGSQPHAVDWRRVRAGWTVHNVLVGLGIAQEDEADPLHWSGAHAGTPYWAAAIGEIGLRLFLGGTYGFRDDFGERDPKLPDSAGSWADQFIEKDIAAALKGPLQAMAIDPAKMDREALGDYITAMVPVLFQVVSERHRQQEEESHRRANAHMRRRWDSDRAAGLPLPEGDPSLDVTPEGAAVPASASQIPLHSKRRARKQSE